MSNEQPLDLERLRQETAATSRIIHFNNAGASLQPSCVTEAVMSHLEAEQELGAYEAANLVQAELAEFYSATAALLNCQPDEIAYVENATRGWQLALASVSFEAGDLIVTTAGEYASNYLELLHLQKRRQIRILTMELGADGLVDLQALHDLLQTQKRQGARLRMLCLTHISSQRGDVQPAAEIGRLADDFGMLFLLDACQSAGQKCLDVDVLGCDFLCASGRKYLRGPRGTGFLYVNQKRLAELEPPFIDLHSASWQSPGEYALSPGAQRFEIWERNIAGQLGLAKAIAYCNQLGMKNIEARIDQLQTRLHDGLALLAGIEYLELSAERCGIVSFYSENLSSEDIHRRLAAQGINCSLVRARNAQLDIAIHPSRDACRASVHYYNSEEEVDRFLQVLEESQA